MSSDAINTPTFETERLRPSDSPPIEKPAEEETGEPLCARGWLVVAGLVMVAILMAAQSLFLLAAR